MKRLTFDLRLLAPLLALPLVGCPEPSPEPIPRAEGVYAPLGEILPDVTEEQRESFERGLAIAAHRFHPDEGLGPQTNVGFCVGCHEKPVFGGGAPRYRDFFIAGTTLADGSFLPQGKGGVVTSYDYEGQARPDIEEGVNTKALRSPIPFWGVGLIAELDEASILANVDEDDANGDGISGRANYDRGFVGRFGRKSQTVSIEGFIRGPLFNHMGITTDPLSEQSKAKLPVPSQTVDPADGDASSMGFRQAAAPSEPLTDDDGIPDPELPEEDLFDLVSYAMLVAAPEFDEPTPQTLRGQGTFQEVGCEGCHVESLAGPRGRIPLYSDLLLHDMGPEMADGIVAELATGSEFRTQPLWGIAAVAPYLHDGRADTLHDAILWHGGEAEGARDAYAELGAERQADLIAFLRSLGGAELESPGLLPPGADVPAVGEPGAPLPMDDEDLERWVAGRALFDQDMALDDGLGPLFNGDSCRACHFEPVIGGAGEIGLNVMQHGTATDDGFEAPEYGTVLHKLAVSGRERREHEAGHNVFQMRQTPSVLGAGLIETIDEDDIRANEDPNDLDGDGIRGVAQVLADGRLGRFGWKAQVPSLHEFTRDAMTVELGMTVPEEEGFTFGTQTDDDDVADPELTVDEVELVAFFMRQLAPPEPKHEVDGGLEMFELVGCDGCHTPELPGQNGPVRLFSDLLLHSVAAGNAAGIPVELATATAFRTPPLWGIGETGPYMHDGMAATLEAAILAHDGEAQAVRAAYELLSDDDQAVLIAFLESL